MKRSIRIRVTVIFAGLTMLILLGIWAANNLFLRRYYESEKVDALEQAYEEIDALAVKRTVEGGSLQDDFPDNGYFDSGEQTEGVRLLRQLEDQDNIMTILADTFTDYPIVSSGRDVATMMERIRRYIIGDQKRDDEILETISETKNYTIQKSYYGRTGSYYLECWGFLSDNRTLFILSTPLESIEESVRLSNRFLIYVGAAAMLLSLVVMYAATSREVRPILKLSELSERMSRLDFDARYEGTEEDEIGILGRSMNVMSDRLQQAIEQLRSANLKLQQDIQEKTQIDEMRREFIADVSHELKTPIALIQGYAEGLAEGMAEDPDSRDYYCGVIVDEANKMNRMVKQLLTLSALEFGSDQVEMERFDVTEVIRGVLSSAGILIQQKNAEIQLEMSPPVYVWADEFKIEEVLTNYLSNALNHLGGERIIRISVTDNGETARVAVRNTGDPIPENELSNIWTKFYKVDKARTRGYGGSGIGLSIVKAIMESHRQSYGAYNTEDGVEFWFTLQTRRDG